MYATFYIPCKSLTPSPHSAISKTSYQLQCLTPYNIMFSPIGHLFCNCFVYYHSQFIGQFITADLSASSTSCCIPLCPRMRQNKHTLDKEGKDRDLSHCVGHSLCAVINILHLINYRLTLWSIYRDGQKSVS